MYIREFWVSTKIKTLGFKTREWREKDISTSHLKILYLWGSGLAEAVSAGRYLYRSRGFEDLVSCNHIYIVTTILLFRLDVYFEDLNIVDSNSHHSQHRHCCLQYKKLGKICSENIKDNYIGECAKD